MLQRRVHKLKHRLAEEWKGLKPVENERRRLKSTTAVNVKNTNFSPFVHSEAFPFEFLQ